MTSVSRTVSAVVLAVLLVTSGITAVTASTGDLGVSPSVDDDRPLVLSPEVPDEVVETSDGVPEFIVTVESDKADSLTSWVQDSEARAVETQISSDKYVVSAPVGDVISPKISLSDALIDRSYVTGLSYNSEVSMVEPVELSSESEGVLDPNLLQKVSSFSVGDGEWTTDGVAFDEDVSETTLGDARTTYNSGNVAADGSGITVAVLDTGTTYESSLYGDRITHGYNFVDETSIDKSSSDYSAIADGNGHGSWVSTAVAGNGTSEAATGMAPGANLAVGKVLADDGSGQTDDIVSGFDWACNDVEADVVSASLGSPIYNQEIASQVQECVDNGTVVVVAAGNSRMNPATMYVSSPANTPSDGVIAVSATNTASAENAKSAYFSEVGPARGVDSGGETRGEMPDIGASGMKITATVAEEDGTLKDSTLSGTSMSTPVVSGAIAVSMEADSSLQGDPQAVKTRIEETAQPAPQVGQTEVGNGVLDVEALATNTQPDSTQEEVRNDPAIARDTAHQSWAGRPNTVDYLIGLFE